MPEMPEVEIVVRGLRPKLIGRKIIAAKAVENKDNVLIYPKSEEFLKKICGLEFMAIRRQGKYIICQLSQGYKLVVHLRMTGKFLNFTREELAAPELLKIMKFACVEFILDNDTVLIYNDVRRFGTLYLVKDEELSIIKGLINLGPEPLSAEFTVAYLKKVLQNRQVAIKTLLLDQSIVAGLGNIYVDEALALAKINPLRPGKSLTVKELEDLQKGVNKVIAAGIEDGGTSFRDYRNAENKKGNHQEHLLVFQRGGEPCFTCQTPIKKIKLGGRGTHFCPRCQPE